VVAVRCYLRYVRGANSARGAVSSGDADPAGSAPLVVLTLVLFLRRIVGVVGGQTLDTKDVEIAVLRHQLAVVRR
jgi:hypothetical protein